MIVKMFVVLLALLLLATPGNAGLIGSILELLGLNSSSSPPMKDTFDFIVVGSGSAGAVVANRLSEDGRFNVLLLEAGSDPTFLSDYPIFWPLLMNTGMDWSYRTTPQRQSCEACENFLVPVPRGKALGGTSSINAMMYVRGNRYDFDRWAELGNKGWGYEDVLPYFLKSENNLNEEMLKSTKYHRAGGPLFVRDLPYHTPLANYFLEAGIENGFLITPDINGANQTGVIAEQVTMGKDGHRWGTKKAYLDPAKNRKNLEIRKDAFVTKVLFDSNKQAVGVEYISKKNKITVKATKEVILSAGVINTPQILMVSGVGPAGHLAEFSDISLVADVPGVGQNLQEHPMTWGLFWKVDIDISYINIKSVVPALLELVVKVILAPLLSKDNPLSANTGLEALAFFKSSFADQTKNWPDMEFQFIALSTDLPYEEEIRNVAGFNKDVFDKFFKPAMNVNGFTILPILTSAKSRGNLKLNSSDPFGYPIIDPKFFSNDEDRKKLIEGLKLAFKFGESAAFKKVNAKFYDKKIPGCDAFTIGDDNYFECMVTKYTATAWHPVGTCKMGPDDDEFAVVNEKLKVRKVKKLRVVDGSIMPFITNGNTNAPTIMIGERASALILDDYRA